MDYNNLEYYLSSQRLNRFLVATGSSKIKAKKLYRINLRVAQAFYPILNLFEIFLRNSINYQLSAYFINPDWIISERNGFMSNRSLQTSKFFLKNSVVKAERTIRKKGGTITSGKIIAEQSFGFWTSLFETHHYRLIGGTVIHCFPNKPSHVNRNILNQKLNRVREFRNRIYHNEPICFNNQNVDFTQALNIKLEIFELLEWINEDLTDYVKYFDNVDAKARMLNNL